MLELHSFLIIKNFYPIISAHEFRKIFATLQSVTCSALHAIVLCVLLLQTTRRRVLQASAFFLVNKRSPKPVCDLRRKIESNQKQMYERVIGARCVCVFILFISAIIEAMRLGENKNRCSRAKWSFWMTLKLPKKREIAHLRNVFTFYGNIQSSNGKSPSARSSISQKFPLERFLKKHFWRHSSFSRVNTYFLALYRYIDLGRLFICVCVAVRPRHSFLGVSN